MATDNEEINVELLIAELIKAGVTDWEGEPVELELEELKVEVKNALRWVTGFSQLPPDLIDEIVARMTEEELRDFKAIDNADQPWVKHREAIALEHEAQEKALKEALQPLEDADLGLKEWVFYQRMANDVKQYIEDPLAELPESMNPALVDVITNQRDLRAKARDEVPGEVDRQLENLIIAGQGDKYYSSAFALRERVRQQIMSEKKDAGYADPSVEQSEIDEYLAANPDLFEQHDPYVDIADRYPTRQLPHDFMTEQEQKKYYDELIAAQGPKDPRTGKSAPYVTSAMYKANKGPSRLIRDMTRRYNSLMEFDANTHMNNLRHASTLIAQTMLRGGTVSDDEIAAMFGINPGDADSLAKLRNDIIGYQQNEWMLDDTSERRGGRVNKMESRFEDGAQHMIYADEEFMMNLPFKGTSLLEAKMMWNSLTDEEMASLQILMNEMGLYDQVDPYTQEKYAKPKLGVYSGTDAHLWSRFLLEVQAENMPVQALIRNKVDDHMAKIAREGISGDRASSADRDGDGIPDNIFSITSRDTLNKLATTIASDLAGVSKLDSGYQGKLVESSMAREKAYLRALNGSFVANRLNQGMTTVDDVDLFLEAIGVQESSNDYNARNPDSGARGKFQFMPETWRTWVRKSNLDRTGRAPMTPENQEWVARAMASHYFNEYGNWYDAAVAWYQGPGAVGNWNRQIKEQKGNYPSGFEYGLDIVREMHAAQQRRVQQWGEVGNQGVTIADDGTVFVEEHDANAYMRRVFEAQNQAAVSSWEGHERYQDFLGMVANSATRGTV